MTSRSILGLAIGVVCLAILFWLANAAGILPAGLGTGSRLTPAPDKDQGPAYALPGNHRKNTAPASTRPMAGAPPTPMPEQHKTPSAQPAPPHQQPAAIHYTTSHRVNIRSGPGTGYGAVGQTTPGATVTLEKDPGGKWIRIRSGKISGWVYKSLFKKTD